MNKPLLIAACNIDIHEESDFSYVKPFESKVLVVLRQKRFINMTS